jgi:hypothetical protein
MTYTDEQIRTARALLDMIEVHGYESCKNVVLLRQILDSPQKEVKHGEEEQGDIPRHRLH